MNLMMTINNAVSMARQAFSGGMSLDSKRPDAWCTYGYPTEISFEEFKTAYERTGAGHGAVERIVGKCWEKVPRIKLDDGKDDETTWEKQAGLFFQEKKTNVWNKIIELDRRGLVGYYSAIIYQVADNKRWDQPLETAQRLVKLIPCWENEIKPSAWDMDTSSERYGEPTMWSYTENMPFAQDKQPVTQVQIHWTRVQEMRTVPLLKAGFNHIIDMCKVSGGSGESFLKNSARTVSIEFDKDADPTVKGVDGAEPVSLKDAINKQIRALNTNQDAAIVLLGAKVTTLQTTIADPTGPWAVPANEFAASVQLPFTVLFGQQTGRLASDQDNIDTANRCGQRRLNECEPMLTEFIIRMQAATLLPAGEFKIEWSDLLEPSDKDRLEKAKIMADTNKVTFESGAEPVYTQEEMRLMADYDPMVIERPVVDVPPETIGKDKPVM
jgi:Protein of unknown function (DUF1073).